jgi:hypothetical protein
VGNDAVEPVEVDGMEGAEVPGDGAPGMGEEVVPPGSEGAPVLEGDGDGVEGMPESPLLGEELPLGEPDGLGVDGAPPPEFVLQPLATSTALTANAMSEERTTPRSLTWFEVVVVIE